MIEFFLLGVVLGVLGCLLFAIRAAQKKHQAFQRKVKVPRLELFANPRFQELLDHLRKASDMIHQSTGRRPEHLIVGSQVQMLLRELGEEPLPCAEGDFWGRYVGIEVWS